MHDWTGHAGPLAGLAQRSRVEVLDRGRVDLIDNVRHDLFLVHKAICRHRLYLLGSTVVVGGLLLLQWPLLQFQQSQAQLKLQLHYLL